MLFGNACKDFSPSGHSPQTWTCATGLLFLPRGGGGGRSRPAKILCLFSRTKPSFFHDREQIIIRHTPEILFDEIAVYVKF